MNSTSRVAMLSMAAFAAVLVDETSYANAKSRRDEAQTEASPASTPRLAVIALAQQHISVYGDMGKIREASISSGAPGYETPAGIYSILEKEEEHHSNLYDDASMPFMERLTWTGIAMHAGALPGHPASHGCTRLPYSFARQLYQVTKPGMRVVVVREDITPADIEQPEMFNRAPEASLHGVNMPGSPNETEIPARLQTTKEEKLAEAEAAKAHELKARAAAEKKAAEAVSAAHLIATAEGNLARLQAELNAGKSARETVSNRTGKAEAAKARVAAKIQAARSRLDTAKAQAEVNMNAAKQAEDEAKTAARASIAAAEAAEIARQNAWPASVFISRKTQRLYIRRGREPVFESPITIRDPDKPIGTFVFTALSYTGTPRRMRWSVVSMYENATNIEPYSAIKRGSKKQRAAKPADVTGAQNALGRLVIPHEAVEPISRLLLPGASLIISDEGLSNETGKDTDFVVFMSGEPQGGAAIRAAQDTPGERKRSRKPRSYEPRPRSRPHAAGPAWSGGGFSLFPSLFGF
jgi:hypothetical protein